MPSTKRYLTIGLAFAWIAAALSGYMLPAQGQTVSPPGAPLTSPSPKPVEPIPAGLLDLLRVGGVNLVFDWYEADNFRPRGFDDELPLIKAAGGGHVRLVISMDVLEEGTTGALRADRWGDLKAFVEKAKGHGLATIIDVHNTGQKNPDGTWTHDFMGRITDPAMQARHLRLLREISARSFAELDREWIVINPGNEPLSPVWYEHQDRLMPVIRSACPDCVVFAMAIQWQVIGATIRELKPRSRPWWDARFVADVHMYSPLSFTHCSYPGQANKCPGKTWPGHYDDYLPTGGKLNGMWLKPVLEHELNKLWAWRDANGGIAIHFSEIGTTGDLDDEPRGAYLEDVVSLLQAAGVGWSCYEWHKNFGIKNAPRTKAACFKGPKSDK